MERSYAVEKEIGSILREKLLLAGVAVYDSGQSAAAQITRPYIYAFREPVNLEMRAQLLGISLYMEERTPGKGKGLMQMRAVCRHRNSNSRNREFQK